MATAIELAHGIRASIPGVRAKLVTDGATVVTTCAQLRAASSAFDSMSDALANVGERLVAGGTRRVAGSGLLDLALDTARVAGKLEPVSDGMLAAPRSTVGELGLLDAVDAALLRLERAAS